MKHKKALRSFALNIKNKTINEYRRKSYLQVVETPAKKALAQIKEDFFSPSYFKRKYNENKKVFKPYNKAHE